MLLVEPFLASESDLSSLKPEIIFLCKRQACSKKFNFKTQGYYSNRVSTISAWHLQEFYFPTRVLYIRSKKHGYCTTCKASPILILLFNRKLVFFLQMTHTHGRFQGHYSRVDRSAHIVVKFTLFLQLTFRRRGSCSVCFSPAKQSTDSELNLPLFFSLRNSGC